MGGVAFRELKLSSQYFTNSTFASLCKQALESDGGCLHNYLIDTLTIPQKQKLNSQRKQVVDVVG